MIVPPTSQNPAEFKKLLEIFKTQNPKNILEIGTHEGGTLFYWLQNALPLSTVGSIDIQGIVSNVQASVWAGVGVRALVYKGDSTHQQAIDWAKNNIGPIDWLFIDGGHDYETVKADWYNYSPLVREGGMITFHDILPQDGYKDQMCEVDKLWEELKNYFPHTEIIEPHEEWGRGPGIGVIYK
jgi:predicted O-methyltransferase YrrM